MRGAKYLGPMLLAGLVALPACGKEEESKPSPGIKVTKGTVEQVITEVGELGSVMEVEIRTEISGQVTGLYVDVGDKVKKGQLLAKVRGGFEAEQYRTAEIRSPIDGVVVNRKTGPNGSEVEVGDRIRDSLSGFSSGTVLMEVAQMDQLLFEVEINEVDVSSVRKGQPCQVTVDAVPGRTFPGTVARVSPVAKTGRRDVRVFDTEISLDEATLELRPGMTARARIVVARDADVSKLNLSRYYLENCGGQSVSAAYVQGEDGVERRVLEVGAKDGSHVAVLKGLAEGEEALQRPEGRPTEEECSQGGSWGQGGDKGDWKKKWGGGKGGGWKK